MIADTTFLSDFHDEHERRVVGPARHFLAFHRARPLRITVISVAEIAVIFDTNTEARTFLSRFCLIKNIHSEIAYVAAEIDRETLERRLGENDLWIAAFCRYHGEPIVSRDRAFDRVPGLRRLAY